VTESLPLKEIGAVQARLDWMRDSYRSGDEYDTNAITHVMACTSRFRGRFLRPETAVSPGGAAAARTPQ
jgi:hypothetical protein